jgi:fibronectin type 3 domain-containing protein
MRTPFVVAATLLAAISTSVAASTAEAQRVPSSAPASVFAKSGNASVTLSWTPVAGAAGYHVYRGANGRWEPDPVASTRQTTHTSEELENGTAYSFTVAAYTKAGSGPLSLAVTTTPIAPPADVVLQPGDQRVTLQWTPSQGATSYTVYRRVENLAFDELATGVLSPPFVDTNLTNGKIYHYRLRAVVGAAESQPSPAVSARVGRQ